MTKGGGGLALRGWSLSRGCLVYRMSFLRKLNKKRHISVLLSVLTFLASH